METRTKAYQERKQSLNYSALSRQLAGLKKTDCPWLKEATATCHTQKLIDQDKAFKNFFAGRAKHPRFNKNAIGVGVKDVVITSNGWKC